MFGDGCTVPPKAAALASSPYTALHACPKIMRYILSDASMNACIEEV